MGHQKEWRFYSKDKLIKTAGISFLSGFVSCLAFAFVNQANVVETQPITVTDTVFIEKPKAVDIKPFTSHKYPQSVGGVDIKKVLQYIDDHKDIAVEHNKKYGIPASVKLAQGIFESASGTSRLSKKSNNHFGIKCQSRECKKGHCSNFTDDSHKDFFRNFESVKESYKYHSEFLTKCTKRKKACYGWLVERYPVGSGNYITGWCYGLKESGYATLESYPVRLKSVIDKLNLKRFDVEK